MAPQVTYSAPYSIDLSITWGGVPPEILGLLSAELAHPQLNPTYVGV
jgi:hypothetical protein